MQDDGAILGLGRLEADTQRERVRANERPRARMDDRAVAAEPQRGARGTETWNIGDEREPVLYLCR